MALENGGFESPTIAKGGQAMLAASSVPGWSTNDSKNQIEIWSSGFQGVPAAEGQQFAELNANSASRLYQDVATTPGQTLSWSLMHRGRNGTDVMRVVIGVPGGTLTQNGSNLSDGNTAWGLHAGTYTVPAGQTTTRFGFEAVSAAGGASVGNFLDAITFGTSPCLITTKTVQNVTRGGTTAEVGDVLRYTVTTRNGGGNPAQKSTSTDQLAAGIDFVPGSMKIVAGAGAGALTDVSGDDRGDYSQATRTVTVRLGDGGAAATGGAIGVDASTSYTFDATVNASAAGGVVLNQAQVAFYDTVADQNRTSTSQETQTPVNQAADLAIAKKIDTADLVIGRPATFTITVSNNGPNAATGVSVRDVLPAGLTNARATSTAGSCTVAATVDCALPNLAVGGLITITVTGTVSPSMKSGDALTNTASVSGSLTDPNPGNNTATVTGTVRAETGTLTLQKKVVNAYGGTSTVSDWTLTATGPRTITGKTGAVAVTKAVVPAGSYALSESGPAGYAAGPWICTGGTVSGSSVAVPDKADVVCTITNSDMPGAVTWTKTAEATGSLLSGSEWTITGPGFTASNNVVKDCVVDPCAGADKDPTPGAFRLMALAWGSYTVTETRAPAGYIASASFAFTVTGDTAGTTQNLGAKTNQQQPGAVLPLTGGLGSDTFFLVGGALLAGTLILLAIVVWRRQRASRTT